MSLNRCCSAAVVRSRLGSSNSSHTTYRKKKSVAFHSLVTIAPVCRKSPSRTAVVCRSGAVSSFSTRATTSSQATTSEIVMAGVLALISSAAMMYAFPSSISTRKSHASCSAAALDPEARYPSHHGFDPGGGRNEGDATIKARPFATMALASYDHIHGSGNMEMDRPIGPQKVVTVQESKTRDSSRDRPYDVSVRALKGGRVTMEDEYFVAEGGRFVAVFDGHGGGGVSQFLKHHLYDAVCQHLRQDKLETGSAVSPSSPHPPRRSAIPSVISHAMALKAAFAEIEESVLVDETLRYQGSTAVAVCLHECNQGHRTLLSANVGDSRAVLSRRGRAVDLTRDHKPNDERERARILAMGETIEWDRLSQVHRVRNLSLSRAIGDRFAKPVVSGDVEINHFPIMEDADEFIILASDGLWDAMTSEEAVSFVHQTVENELSSANIAKDDISNYKLVLRRNMAKFVAREAMRRGSCDNVCVIMVWLNDLRQ